MGADHPPARFLREAGLVVLPEEIRPREGRAWLVGWQKMRGVLRRLPVPVALAADLAKDATWLHGFMTRLAGAGFPSPRPLPCFDGMSWIMAGGWLWEIVSFIPGHAVGWAAVPPMEEIGTLLGRYHMAVRQIPVTSQRPAALPLAEVPPVLLSHQLDAILPERAAPIRQLAAQLARDLDDTGHLARERVVIHGDFTNDNVIARGMPPAASGVIDFAGPTWKRRWRTSGMACGAAAVPMSALVTWSLPDSGGFSAAMPASSGSRPTRPASFPSMCGVVDFR